MCLVWRRAGQGDEEEIVDGKEYTQTSSDTTSEDEHYSLKKRSTIRRRSRERELDQFGGVPPS